MSWSPTDNNGRRQRLPGIFPAIGEPQGKVGKKVYLRSWTGAIVYARNHPEYPKRRTEPQRRTMRAMQSAAPAWRRLSPLEQDAWRNNPPIKTMARKNRGAWSKHSSGWNWFIGLYLKEAATMQFAAVETPTVITVPAGSTRTPLIITLPDDHPTNLLIRVNMTTFVTPPTADVPVTVALKADEGLPTLALEEIVSLTSKTDIPLAWSTGIRYRSSGDAQIITLSVGSGGGEINLESASLEVLY